MTQEEIEEAMTWRSYSSIPDRLPTKCDMYSRMTVYTTVRFYETGAIVMRTRGWKAFGEINYCPQCASKSHEW